MKAARSQIAGASLKNMFSFYMQTFLKTALIISLLSSSFAFAAELELEEVPLVPVSGKKKVTEGEPEKPTDTLDTHVLNGFSVGSVVYNQSYNIKVNVFYNGTAASVNSNTADLQNIGVVGRYSVIPVGSFGTDFALTLASSINHDSAGFSPVLTTRFEMNLGWGFLTAGKLPYYVFGGFGYEGVNGSAFNQLVTAPGGIVQFGCGVSYSKKLVFEGVAGLSRHGVSSNYYDRITAAGVANGFSSVTFENDKSFVTSYIISGRLMYKF